MTLSKELSRMLAWPWSRPLRRHAVDVRRVDERLLGAVADAVPGDAAARSVVAGVLVEVVDVSVAHVIDHDEDDVGRGGEEAGEEEGRGEGEEWFRGHGSLGGGSLGARDPSVVGKVRRF